MNKENTIAFQAVNNSVVGIAFVILNLIVKGIYISSNSLAGDEPFSVYHAQMNIASIIQLLSQGNNPPLYEIVLHYWIKVFGISEFAVRFPSLIFSSVTVFFVYKIAADYIAKRVAFIAAFVFTFSNYFILFAHEARVYALLGLLTSVSMYIFMRILNNSLKAQPNVRSSFNSNKLYLLLALINALIIYAHYFGFFVLIVQFLYLVINPKILKKIWKNIFISAILIMLLYLPNIAVLLYRFLDSSNGTWVQPPNGIESIYNMLWVFSNKPITTVMVIAVLIASIIIFLIRRKVEKQNIYIELVVLWFGFIFLIMFAVSFWLPMFMDRYLMPAAIAFPIMVGTSVDYVSKKFNYPILLPLMIVGAFVATSKPNITNGRNAREAVAKIKELQSSNSIVYFCPDWFDLNFVYYYNINYFKNYDTVNIKDNIHRSLARENIFPISNSSQINYDLIKTKNHLIYLDAAADFSYPNNKIKQVLDENFKAKSQYDFPDIFHVIEYDTK